MKKALGKLTFIFLTTAILVFFSEKVFWYVQGFAILELLLFYAAPTAACLWAIDAFRVRDLYGMVLIGALFGFLVEGVLTPVIYEAGLLDPIMPAYFIGWHGLLSVVFGWYLIRVWLLKGAWGWVLAASGGVGLFWGVWSLTYRLPESIAEFETLANAGEPVRPGIWPAQEFTLYTLVFTGMLIMGHWLLGQGGWKPGFQLSRWGKIGLGAILAALFGLLVLSVLPLAFLKLTVLIGLALIPLWVSKRHQPPGSLLGELTGPVKITHALSLLAMPAAASLVYGLAAVQPPEQSTLELVQEITPVLQSLVGGVNYLLAAGVLIFRSRAED